MTDWKDRVEIKLYKDHESKLNAEAERFLAADEMPSLEEVVTEIEETRKKYRL
jgi:hypothetical protein